MFCTRRWLGLWCLGWREGGEEDRYVFLAVQGESGVWYGFSLKKLKVARDLYLQSQCLDCP